MANEATLMVETQLPIMMTCADGAGIEKGTICVMTDPLTAAAATTSGQIIAGIAAEEKIASDGKTKIAIYRGGIFKVTGSGNITVGNPLVHSPTPNIVQTAAVNAETVLGIALETSTNTETLLIELRPTTMNLA